MDHFNTDSSRWHALQTRNPRAANSFVYCVRSTRVVCRPNCAARLARRSNVIFRDSFTDARAAGYRPCKRCRPELEVYDPRVKLVARACETIREGRVDVRLSELAASAGVTKSHFHKVFKEVTGVTPRIYAVNLRAKESTSTHSLMSTPCFSPAAASPTESLDALVPFTPHGARRDISKEFINPDLLAIRGYPREPGKLLQDGSDEAMLFALGNRKTIEYTVQPWASGFVIIAVTGVGVCWLEAGDSVSELNQSLRSQFPISKIMASTWPERFACRGLDSSKHAMFSAVMEALVKPTGKILNFLFDVS